MLSDATPAPNFLVVPDVTPSELLVGTNSEELSITCISLDKPSAERLVPSERLYYGSLPSGELEVDEAAPIVLVGLDVTNHTAGKYNLVAFGSMPRSGWRIDPSRRGTTASRTFSTRGHQLTFVLRIQDNP